MEPELVTVADVPPETPKAKLDSLVAVMEPELVAVAKDVSPTMP